LIVADPVPLVVRTVSQLALLLAVQVHPEPVARLIGYVVTPEAASG
jgi:hypothetical protein